MAHNAYEVLEQVKACMAELEEASQQYCINDHNRMQHYGYGTKKLFNISAVCDELSIFDWWNETLSMNQLKKMQEFLEKAIKMGYTGYVCFKVGAAGCSNGMWAHKQESTNGYSPDGACLYRGFRSDTYNEWDACLDDGETWLHDIVPDQRFTLKHVKNMLAGCEQ